MNAVNIAAVHGVGAGRKRFSLPAAVGRIAGALAVNHVGSDRQYRLRMNRIAISRVLPQLAHELRYDPRCQLIDAIIVVAEVRKLAFGDVIGYQTRGVAHDLYLRVLNGRKTVGNY